MVGVLIGVLLGGGAGWFINQRVARCAYVPLIADNLLPNANLARGSDDTSLPQGWVAGAPGVQVGTFALDGDQRSLQLMGIANFVQTPPIPVQPGRAYCFTGHAITDSGKGSSTRVRVTFRWLDGQGQELVARTTPWQPVVLWQEAAPPDGWSRIAATFTAPPEASTLLIRIAPSSDDRVYLDVFQVRRTVKGARQKPAADSGQSVPGPGSLEKSPFALAPWPDGTQAAVSFSFDWETTMAGLIHSRSVGDPHTATDPVERGLRMREGITATLNLFRPYGVRATYYAAGYTLLVSNTTSTQWMGNPTYAWATTRNRWTSDHWQTTPWFAPDPAGTAQSHPSWYAGDLVPPILRAGHDIQSHTFSHFYGGFVQAQDWHDDLTTWNQVAAARGVPAARSLAFPWSSSGGMSDASWDELEAAGITSVTRLSDQSQYNLFPLNEDGVVAAPRCLPLPGHERLLACPDVSLTPSSADQVLATIDHTLEVGGAIDVWSHTEEVTTEEQQVAWERVVRYAATRPDVWIAPLREIADWQQAREAVRIQIDPPSSPNTAANEDGSSLPFTVTVANHSNRDLEGLTLRSDLPIGQGRLDGQPLEMKTPHEIPFAVRAGQTRELQLWPIP